MLRLVIYRAFAIVLAAGSIAARAAIGRVAGVIGRAVTAKDAAPLVVAARARAVDAVGADAVARVVAVGAGQALVAKVGRRTHVARRCVVAVGGADARAIQARRANAPARRIAAVAGRAIIAVGALLACLPRAVHWADAGAQQALRAQTAVGLAVDAVVAGRAVVARQAGAAQGTRPSRVALAVAGQATEARAVGAARLARQTAVYAEMTGVAVAASRLCPTGGALAHPSGAIAADGAVLAR